MEAGKHSEYRNHRKHRENRKHRDYRDYRKYRGSSYRPGAGIKSIVQRFRNEIIFLALLLPLLWVTGSQLNRLSVELLFRGIESEGVNYDAFRELKLGEEVPDDAGSRTLRLYQKHPELERYRIIDSMDYITFSMFAGDFDLSDGRLVDDDILLKGFGRIAGLRSYEKLRGYYKAILADLKYFPVPRVMTDEKDITYTDSWNDPRSYGGSRRHEGTDIMGGINKRGHYPVISITDGSIEKMGWLEQGGYRIGVRSPSGGYFYYAHLASYAPGLKEGDGVYAGQLLGFMGDSGYGSEGTVGKFDVHLHVGIYVDTQAGEMSVNPYYILKTLEKSRTTCVAYTVD